VCACVRVCVCACVRVCVCVCVFVCVRAALLKGAALGEVCMCTCVLNVLPLTLPNTHTHTLNEILAAKILQSLSGWQVC